MISKIIQSLLFFIFLLFAALQYNDPDGPAWIVIYGAVALLSLLAVLGIYRRSITIGLIIVLVLLNVYLAPHFYDYLLSPDKSEIFGEMVYEKSYIEGTREFLGVFIAILALLGILRLNRSSS